MAEKQPDSAGYQPIFGTKDKKPIPKWVPVTLLAVSTVALVVPVVLLRRHRAATRVKNLFAAPPPRRTTSSKGAPVANPHVTTPTFTVRDPSPPSAAPSSSPSAALEPDDGFNPALQCLKAFSLATLFVGVGATTAIWGIRRYMEVDTTQEFADRMRHTILTKLPVLSARIHRSPEPADGDDVPPRALVGPDTADGAMGESWTWPAAERRLKEAYETHGFSGWVAAAMHELEVEGRIERTKRGHV